MSLQYLFFPFIWFEKNIKNLKWIFKKIFWKIEIIHRSSTIISLFLCSFPPFAALAKFLETSTELLEMLFFPSGGNLVDSSSPCLLINSFIESFISTNFLFWAFNFREFSSYFLVSFFIWFGDCSLFFFRNFCFFLMASAKSFSAFLVWIK